MAVPVTHDLASVYLHWGVVQISAANAVVILVMALVFVAALLVPFPHGRDEHATTGTPPAGTPPAGTGIATGTTDDRNEGRSS